MNPQIPLSPCRYLECYFNHRASVAKVALPLNTENMLFPLLCAETVTYRRGYLIFSFRNARGFSEQHKTAQTKVEAALFLDIRSGLHCFKLKNR